MNSKPKKKMKVKLNSKDVLEIAKALKCGWLDMGKVERSKSLLEGYNPPKQITQEQMGYYLDCLYKGIGYKPNDEAKVMAVMQEGLDKDLLENWQRSIEDGSVNKRLVRDAFFGMVAIKAMGGTFDQPEFDFSFCETQPDFEI